MYSDWGNKSLLKRPFLGEIGFLKYLHVQVKRQFLLLWNFLTFNVFFGQSVCGLINELDEVRWRKLMSCELSIVFCFNRFWFICCSAVERIEGQRTCFRKSSQIAKVLIKWWRMISIPGTKSMRHFVIGIPGYSVHSRNSSIITIVDKFIIAWNRSQLKIGLYIWGAQKELDFF